MAGIFDTFVSRLSDNPINTGILALANKYPAVDQWRMGLGERTGQLLNDPTGFMKSAVQDVVPTPKGLLHALAGQNTPEARQAEQRMQDIALAGMTVYHGSPYKFDKFDMSKIGTGEGAQAYGHGLYFAENPGVAQSYVPKSGNPLWKGKTVSSYGMDGSVNFADGTIGKVADNEWGSFRRAMESGPRTGNLYKVDLPDEHIAKMLDWDKPLSQQPEALNAFRNARELAGMSNTYWQPGKLATGSQQYGMLVSAVGKEKASQLLMQQGIPGIRYLDGGSRGAGQGTYNYVVFDDKLPKIIGTE